MELIYKENNTGIFDRQMKGLANHESKNNKTLTESGTLL